jgi:hypothetical protein
MATRGRPHRRSHAMWRNVAQLSWRHVATAEVSGCGLLKGLRMQCVVPQCLATMRRMARSEGALHVAINLRMLYSKQRSVRSECDVNGVTLS